jgi:WD40 repeat protein/tRNA A-37 threonylcarbamoyl transferase component Bud32
MTTCPVDDLLRAYLVEDLNRSETDAIEAHIEVCSSCQATLARLTDEAAESVGIDGDPVIRLSSPSDTGLIQLKQRLQGAGSRNGSAIDQALACLDPPQVDGDLGSLGPYRVRSVAGRGGTAIVFRGVYSDGRDVAIKVLRPELGDRQNRARFLRGARSAVAVRSQHVVEVVSVQDPPDGMPYVLMAYVDGDTLHERIKREGRLVAREAAEIVRQVAEGLSAAHHQNLVHRDVKSTNILLDRINGQAKIADFGLTRNVQLPPEITRHGEVSGTPEFMSREQILSPDRVDERTDIYGLGVVLYHALTGEMPFRGVLLGVLKQVLEDEPVPPCRLNNTIPRELETICLKCLEKDPGHRYTSAAALAEDLGHYLDGKPIRAKRQGIVRRASRWVRRHPARTTALIVGVVTTSSSGAVVGSIKAAHARAEAESAGKLQVAAEARAEAEHREAESAGKLRIAAESRAQAEHHEARMQEREALIQQMQRVRMTYQREGWSRGARELARRAAAIERDSRIQAEAATLLAGIDARKVKSLACPGKALAFSPEKQLLIGGSNPIRREAERPIQIWDSTTDQVQTTEIKGEGVFGFRADGTPLLLKAPRNEPSTLELWDVAKAQVLRTFQAPMQGKATIKGFAFTPDGTLVAASARGLTDKGAPADTGAIAVWEATTGRELFRSTTKWATEVALAPDASLLAAGHEDGQIRVWSLPNGESIATLKADRNRINCLAIGRDPVRRAGPKPPGNGWLLAAGDDGGGVIVWDLRAGIPKSICHGPTGSSEVLALAFSPDGMTLASTGRGSVQLWDIASGQFLLNVNAGSNYVLALAFSPDGGRLAVGGIAAFGPEESVDIWELEPGRGVESLRGLVRSVYTTTFSPNGGLVAALSNDWHVGIWDRADRRLLHVLEVIPGSHFDSAALAFSPDGRQFAFSAGRDASLWDVATGEPIKTWRLPEGLVERFAFPDPDRLLLFRVETETGEVGPFSNADRRKHPRVCRVRNLLRPEPLKPLAEIRDFNFHVFLSECSPDGKYYAIEGLGDSSGKVRRIANLYEGPTGKKLGALPTQNPIDWDGAWFNFDPTGTMLNYAYSDHAYRRFLLEMPSRAVLRQFDPGPTCLGPRAKRWLMSSGATDDHPAALILLEHGREEPLVKFVLDLGGAVGTGKPRFSSDGQHLVWGGPSGGVMVVDLVEVNRRLSELGLGW